MLTKQQSWTNVRERVTPEEWEQRVALAAVYRLVAHFRWDDLIFTHLSARVPGPDHHFLINPYGMAFDEITASSLVKVGLDGDKVMDSPYEINPAGFTIHSAIHAAREDAKCVLHVHSIKAAIAKEFTRIHVEFTAAPEPFVNIVFSDLPLGSHYRKPEQRRYQMKLALRSSVKQLTVVALCCAIGQAVSISPASAASATVSGSSALALAAVVASHGSLLGSFDKRAISRLFDGKGVFIARVNKITVGADSIICKMSNVDLTARSCDLTFKSHKRTLAGRDANEVYATLALASVMAEGPASSISEGITNLECTVDPTLIKEKAGGGASCTFETGQ
jgi:hypothetical protein